MKVVFQFAPSAETGISGSWSGSCIEGVSAKMEQEDEGGSRSFAEVPAAGPRKTISGGLWRLRILLVDSRK